MQRRQILKLLGASILGNAFAAAPAAALADRKWSYSGDTSPEHWGELSEEFQLCQTGRQQTPIDLSEASAPEPESLSVHYLPTPLSITNTSRTIQVNCEPGSFITFRGETFDLKQFHFHHPSEHQLGGNPFDLEIHLVHRSPAGKLAVVGIFAQTGASNATLKPLWDAIPLEARTTEAKTSINVAQLLPTQRRFYEYRGSLTTPPCSEDVLWFVMVEPIEVSAAQVEQFAAIFPRNARPIQARGDRLIKQSI